ncbi:MAG TPA: M28 family peptidase [Gemmatimonadales bacterium]|jgi:glutaminyl-peptide cyclotransferase|nr:M28 family peptidase [Gemmatimonadales bacterium]
MSTCGMRRAACVALVALLACQARAGGERTANTREFNGTTAFGYVQQQMSFGPRIPNTPGHQQEADWLLAQLRQRADTVIVQEITHKLKNGETLHLRNFVARFRPQASDHILFMAHWDTRPMADRAENLGQQRMPVPGANDGASGVAILLGVADALKARPLTGATGADLLFVDGEDYGDFADTNDVLIGSRWFAAHQPAGYQPLYAVLFDMVGDKDLQIFQEGQSVAGAPEVVQRVWRVAADLGYGHQFVPSVRHTLTDDHVSLQKVGIHAIDVVDFDYPYWHTTDDTIDKVSAESLQIVGDVAVALVRQ